MLRRKNASISGTVKRTIWIMATIPILVIIAGVLIFAGEQIGAIIFLSENTDMVSNHKMNNSIFIDRVIEKEMKEILKVRAANPDELLSVSYLHGLNKALKKKNCYLVSYENSELNFVGEYSKWESIEEVLGHWPIEEEDYEMTFTAENNAFIARRLKVESSTGTENSLFIVHNRSEMYKYMISIIKGVILMAVFIFVACLIVISRAITRSIHSATTDIKKGVDSITEGNLNFELVDSKYEEISILSDALQKMKLRLKKMTEQQVLYDRQSKELISNISHDLKTPIAAIIGYIEGLLDGVPDTPEKRTKYIKTIYIKANAMNSLIDELVLYSKIDTNRIPYAFLKLNVRDYFEDCIEEISFDLEKQGIAFFYGSHISDNITIIGDPEQLKRVIDNIISNAVKYMKNNDSQKIIRLTVLDSIDYIKVCIEDNGKGISEQDVSKVFNRFYRTEASRNSLTGGSGLGLSICRRIIEEHGGTIWAASKKGEGTEMWFTLKKYKGGEHVE